MRLKIADLGIERNGDPFEIEMDDGTVFVLTDPKAIQAETLLTLESLAAGDQVRAMAGDRADELLAHPEADGYFLEKLLEAYMAHYGVGTPPEGHASPSSSNGTARR